MSKRLDAATAGHKFFDSRNPCPRDGTTQRYTTNGACVVCQKAESAKRYDKFRALLEAAKQV